MFLGRVNDNQRNQFLMTNKAAFIFDMDGVLVHSNPDHKKAIDIFCKRYNKSVSEAYLRENVYGTTNREWIPKVFGELSLEEVDRLADEKEALFREIFDPKEHEVKGITAFLEAARQGGIKLAVATSAPAENENFILERLGITDYFDAILNSSHVSHSKPHPEIYLKAIEKLELKPTQCIVFEDSVAGVESGRRAGCRTVGVMTTHTAEEMKDCAMVINDFEALDTDAVLELLP